MKKHYTFFNGFFILYAIAGFLTLSDYGIPLDEITQRVIGIGNAKFIAGGNSHFVSQNGFFGPAFEIFTYIGENFIYNHELGDKLLLRHALVFAVFLLALRTFYSLAQSLSSRPGVALLTTITFALYPVIFAHAHYNTKDTVFMSLVIFNLYFLWKYIQSGRMVFLIVSAVFLGLNTTIRLTGIFVLISTALPLFMVSSDWKKGLKRVLLYGAIFIVSFFVFFPYLWISPIENFGNLLNYVTQNPWPWDTLANGQNIKAGNLPWWYLSLWMGVTIPVATLIFFLAGTVIVIRQKWRRPGFLYSSLFLILCIPVLYFFIFRPTIYNGWRHLQFLIVPVFLLGIPFLDKISNWKWNTYFQWIIGMYALIVFWLWQPFGYVYFNEAYAALYKPATFDQDYWGLSALQGIRWVEKNDSRDSVAISSFTESPELNSYLLPVKTQQRFHFIRKPGQGDYEVEVRRDRYFSNLNGEVVFTICPLKDTILRVVKLQKPPSSSDN